LSLLEGSSALRGSAGPSGNEGRKALFPFDESLLISFFLFWRVSVVRDFPFTVAAVGCPHESMVMSLSAYLEGVVVSSLGRASFLRGFFPRFRPLLAFPE